MKLTRYLLVVTILVTIRVAGGFPDQLITVIGADELLGLATQATGLQATADNSGLELAADRTVGYLILGVQQSEQPFNRGLPSWNGRAGDGTSAFKVFMRFPVGSGWSDWLTAGYWKDHLWSSYGADTFSGGEIDIDYVKLDNYLSSWQFKVEFYRTSTAVASPSLDRISFFVSDTRTTDELNYTSILNDNPPEILIPTDFYYQYSLDSEIGGRICSPTSVSMIIASYDIPVVPVDLAWEIYDPVKGIFGVWPRAVQGGVSKGLEGTVTRYRTWSEAYAVLAQGGRIAMSVGQPLYSGHLIMLAGFDNNGNPIVHDPARSNGYSYKFNKSDISHAWFDKGGISYTFYLPDSANAAVATADHVITGDMEFSLGASYPNPFNATTIIPLTVRSVQHLNITIYDAGGRRVKRLYAGFMLPGRHDFKWDGTDSNGNPVASGTYWVVTDNNRYQRQTKLITLLK